MIASAWTVPCSSMLCIFNPIGSAISLGSYLTFVALFLLVASYLFIAYFDSPEEPTESPCMFVGWFGV